MRICIYADNSCNYVNTLLDIWTDGDCAVLIDPRIPFEKAIEQMVLCNVKKCYIDTELDNLKINYAHKFGILFTVILKEEMKLFQKKSSYDLFFEKHWNHEALILFSSGTTGKSKGIILSYFNIQRNAEMVIDYMRPTADDKILIIKSLAHSSTVVGELLVALKTNTPVILGATTQHMSSLWNYIISNKITILCLNPTLLYLLTQYLLRIKPDISNCNLKKLYTSGSILGKEYVRKIKLILNSTSILNVYGLTEAGPRVTAQRQEEPIGSVGLPIGNVKIIVTDENGRQLDCGQNGIISVKTECLFKGYVSNESTLKKSVYKDWLNTGDIGYIDSVGNLFITGRLDRMIICGSHNVYPEQVEEIIMKYNGIKDCYVYGTDDPILGKKLICIYESKNELNSALLDHCRKHLAQYEIPKEFIYGTISKTPNGKKIAPVIHSDSKGSNKS